MKLRSKQKLHLFNREDDICVEANKVRRIFVDFPVSQLYRGYRESLVLQIKLNKLHLRIRLKSFMFLITTPYIKELLRKTKMF